LLQSLEALQSRRSNKAGSLSRQHVMEIALAMRVNATSTEKCSKIRVEKTSRGLLISAGRVEEGRGCLLHYSISAEDGLLNDRAARRVARMLARLNGNDSVRLVRGSHAFHALIFIAAVGQTEHR